MRARTVGKNFQFCYTTELQETPHSILMCHYEDLSSTSGWLKQIYNQLNLCSRSSDVIWRENVGFFLRLWSAKFA